MPFVDYGGGGNDLAFDSVFPVAQVERTSKQ